MAAIWQEDDPGGAWRLLTPSGYPAEASLHDLVQQAPQLLPLAGAPQITVLGREVALGTGRADLLAVESSGRLVIIEVKLAANNEARRAVVAQVLSYAAYLQGFRPTQLETDVLARHLADRGADTILAAVEADDQQRAIEPRAFTDGLAECLREGSFRLVLVLDDAPPELTQTSGYLQSLTDRIQIDLVTVAAYEVNGSRILVPQRVEPARRVGQLSQADANARQSSSLVPGAADFRAAIAHAPASQRELLTRLTDWAEHLHEQKLVSLQTYHGKAGITTLLPRLPGQAGLVSIYTDPKAAYLQFWRSAFERRAPNTLPKVESALGAPIKQGNSTRDISQDLLGTLTDAYREANQQPTAG
ncbi:hypothetical protein ACFYP7_32215 [Micromonospora arida]|uniref:hypothetical protein n=1 Tax=Micromonospora arida TaxID=2203715 RepID=UPI0036760E76